jgi:hypothetical protein
MIQQFYATVSGALFVTAAAVLFGKTNFGTMQ